MPAFIAYGILNKTKEFGRIGYVHGKDKKRRSEKSENIILERWLCGLGCKTLVMNISFLILQNI